MEIQIQKRNVQQKHLKSFIITRVLLLTFMGLMILGLRILSQL